MNPAPLLATLKQKLRTAKDFSEVMNWFFDHLGEKPEFFDLGEQTRHEPLEKVIAQIAGQLFPGQRQLLLTEMRLVHLEEHQFYHGSVFLNGRLGTMIYFEDINMGLMVVALPAETKLARFSLRPLHRPPERPSPN